MISPPWNIWSEGLLIIGSNRENKFRMDPALLASIFLTGCALNLAYELAHSRLYTTCLQASRIRFAYLMAKATLFDGASIAVFYYATSRLFSADNLLEQPFALAVFAAALAVFAFAWEKYSLWRKKWEYAPSMPRIFGVGLTPLFQLAVTAIACLYIVFYFY